MAETVELERFSKGNTMSDEGTEWFWRIVDANGLGDVPSDEGPALRLLCERAAKAQWLKAENARLQAELETARHTIAAMAGHINAPA
jgi:hypothetical protein